METRSQEPHVPLIQPLVDSWPAPSSVNLSPDGIGLVTIRGGRKAPPANLPWLDDLQSSDQREVPFVECGHLASPFEGDRRHDQVVRTDHFADRLQVRPDARVFIGRLLRVGNNRQRRHHGLEVFSTFGLVRFDRTLHPVPELCYCDGWSTVIFVAIGTNRIRFHIGWPGNCERDFQPLSRKRRDQPPRSAGLTGALFVISVSRRRVILTLTGR
jgi:hypothetical protein